MDVARIKVAGACDVAAIRAAALRANGGQFGTCSSTGDFSRADYLGSNPAINDAIQALPPGQDVPFTLTALNMPFLVRQLAISVAAKGCVAVTSIKIAGVEYLLNGQILADFFDPQAEEMDCPINLPTCALEINQSVVVTLHNYTPGELSFFGGVMARGFT